VDSNSKFVESAVALTAIGAALRRGCTLSPGSRCLTSGFRHSSAIQSCPSLMEQYG
jgi:hypothetical protein